jgi:hypothetical protein
MNKGPKRAGHHRRDAAPDRAPEIAGSIPARASTLHLCLLDLETATASSGADIEPNTNTDGK